MKLEELKSKIESEIGFSTFGFNKFSCSYHAFAFLKFNVSTTDLQLFFRQNGNRDIGYLRKQVLEDCLKFREQK